MPKQRSPDREKAKKIYLRQNGEIQLNEIAAQLNLSEGTIRGWKAKDFWDDELNGAFRAGVKKNTERSVLRLERSNQKGKNPSNNNSKKADVENEAKILDRKTDSNSQTAKARYGNKNAKGNKGGSGGPVGNKHALGNRGGFGGPHRNKKAVRTHEYETLYYDDLDEKERAFLELKDCFNDKYFQQIILIQDLSLRERKIKKTIKEIENTPDGMIFESGTKNKGEQATRFINRNKDGDEWEGNDMFISQDNSSSVMKSVVKKAMELEDVLTRVQSRKQAAIAQLHRMQADDDKLSIDRDKLEIYKQRISGKVDIDTLISIDDIEDIFNDGL